jgi:hypothetical protein
MATNILKACMQVKQTSGSIKRFLKSTHYFSSSIKTLLKLNEILVFTNKCEEGIPGWYRKQKALTKCSKEDVKCATTPTLNIQHFT